MIDWYTSRSNCIDKFFGKVIGFGAVLRTDSNLISRQKPDVLIAAGRGLPHVIIRRPSDPELRKMAEPRPALRIAEQFDAPVYYHPISSPEVRLKEPKASTEITNDRNCSAPY